MMTASWERAMQVISWNLGKAPRNGLIASVLIALMAFGAVAGSTAVQAATPITLGGAIHCHGGAVEGIWVASTGPGSGWASRWNYAPSDTSDNTYHMVLPSGTVQVSFHVGCGGSTSSWATVNTSQERTVSASRTINLFCGNGAKNGPCTYASWTGLHVPGNKLSSNPAGQQNQCQCTYYALQQWYAYEGWYPKISGDAYQWPASAKANGWDVTTVPMRYSFVVFPPNSYSSVGHVAWVDALLQINHQVVGIQIDEGNVHDLNNCSDYRVNEDVLFNNHDPRFGSSSGWRYIPAP
jgi:surface antigen